MVISSSGSLIGRTLQENRQNKLKMTKIFFGRGTLGPISKGFFAKYKIFRHLLWSPGDHQVS